MPNQVSNSVRLILKPFLFDYMKSSILFWLRTCTRVTMQVFAFSLSPFTFSPMSSSVAQKASKQKWRKLFFPQLRDAWNKIIAFHSCSNREAGPIKPLSKSSHTIWCEMTSRRFVKTRSFVKTLVTAKVTWYKMPSRFAPDGIVPEEFKLPSFNHVLLQRKDTNMAKLFFIVTKSNLRQKSLDYFK